MEKRSLMRCKVVTMRNIWLFLRFFLILVGLLILKMFNLKAFPTYFSSCSTLNGQMFVPFSESVVRHNQPRSLRWSRTRPRAHFPSLNLSLSFQAFSLSVSWWGRPETPRSAPVRRGRIYNETKEIQAQSWTSWVSNVNRRSPARLLSPLSARLSAALPSPSKTASSLFYLRVRAHWRSQKVLGGAHFKRRRRRPFLFFFTCRYFFILFVTGTPAQHSQVDFKALSAPSLNQNTSKYKICCLSTSVNPSFLVSIVF